MKDMYFLEIVTDILYYPLDNKIFKLETIPDSVLKVFCLLKKISKINEFLY